MIMTSEIKQCQNCRQNFTIESEDFQFYEKVKVPPPTWCPECRTIRRFLFRNERTWYRRICDATQEATLSMFTQDAPFPVYELNYWKSDAWDPFSYGREVDFSLPFLDQWKKLFHAVPEPNLAQKNTVNSEYSNYVLNLKNCYFVASNDTAEDCAYTFTFVLNARNCLDAHISRDIEWSYEVVDCYKANKLRFSQSCEGCVDSWFLYDCRNCTNCVGCVGLRNKQYCIFNEQYTREEYLTKLKELNLGSFSGLTAARLKFEELKLRIPRKFAAIIQSTDVVGDDIKQSRNVRGFVIRSNSENVRYSYRVSDSKDLWDAFVSWNGSELHYETMACSGQRIFCSALIYGGSDVSYSYNCFDCQDIFGCVGLRNKQYCILNKQYSKEKYLTLREKIIAHMSEMPYTDARGIVYRYGEFFPIELSPFAYNETIAQDYFPSNEESARKFGYSWRDREKRDYKITLKPDSLSDHIRDVKDNILNETIACEHAETDCGEQCATAFKMVPMEIQFYRKMDLPLPRLCPSCRHYGRVKLKNPLRLWHRKCTCAGAKSGNGVYTNTISHFHSSNHCPNEFETSYAPERPEIVYCEACYNAEVV